MRNIGDIVIVEIKTYILSSITFSENGAFCEIIWNNVLEPDRLQRKI